MIICVVRCNSILYLSFVFCWGRLMIVVDSFRRCGVGCVWMMGMGVCFVG